MDALIELLRATSEAFRAGTATEEELYALVHRIGHEEHLQAEAQPIVESLLLAPANQIRYIALQVLTITWACAEHRKTCEAFLVRETDADNRRTAVYGLARLLNGTRDAAALTLLLKIFRDEYERRTTRDSAYSAILSILGRPPSEWPSAARFLDHTKDINWERIEEAEKIARPR